MARSEIAAVSIMAVFLIFAPGVAKADEVADVLAKVDSNLTKVSDQSYTGEIQVIRGGKSIKSLKFTVKLKGLKMKLVRFTDPGDVRGMSVLTTDDGLMYVYLPSYQRVRRIASHVRNQGFMGTDMSPDDFGTAALSVGWSAVIQSQDAEKWVLSLKPASGNESSYSKMIVTVIKSNNAVSKIEYYSQEGKLLKTQVREEVKSFGQITVPTLFTVTDHTTGSKTVMRLFDCKVNTGIQDSAFTSRALLRGE